LHLLENEENHIMSMIERADLLSSEHSVYFLNHLYKMHTLRDENVHWYIFEKLGSEAARTDIWTPFNHFCEMSK